MLIRILENNIGNRNSTVTKYNTHITVRFLCEFSNNYLLKKTKSQNNFYI